MRNRFVGLLIPVLLAMSSGCMVLEEMDAAAAKMPSSGKQSAEPEADAEMTAGRSGAEANPLLEKSREWWNEAKSFAPTGLESGIVGCRLGGSTQFMSKDDCLARGGAPGRV